MTTERRPRPHQIDPGPCAHCGRTFTKPGQSRLEPVPDKPSHYRLVCRSACTNWPRVLPDAASEPPARGRRPSTSPCAADECWNPGTLAIETVERGWLNLCTRHAVGFLKSKAKLTVRSSEET